MAIKFDTSHNITCYRLKELSAATQTDFTTDHEIICKELVEGKDEITFMGQTSAGELRCASIIENDDEIWGSEEDKKKAEEAAEQEKKKQAEQERISLFNTNIKPILMNFTPELENGNAEVLGYNKFDDTITNVTHANNICISNAEDLIDQLVSETGDSKETIISRLHWFLIEERPRNRGRGQTNRDKSSHRQKKFAKRFLKSTFQTNNGEFEKTGKSEWSVFNGLFTLDSPSNGTLQFASDQLTNHYYAFVNTNCHGFSECEWDSNKIVMLSFPTFLNEVASLRKTFTYMDIKNDNGTLAIRPELSLGDIFMYLHVGIGIEYREETEYSHKKIFAYSTPSSKCLEIPFILSTDSYDQHFDLGEKSQEFYTALELNGLSSLDQNYTMGAVPNVNDLTNDSANIEAYLIDWKANDTQ